MNKKNLHLALIQFRNKVETIKKTEENPYFKSKYADLPSILNSIKNLLSECNLSVSHRNEYIDGQLFVITELRHDEESINSCFPVFGKKPQEVGSSMTYARRYNLQCLLDLPTDDDDGNAANDSAAIKQKPWLNLDENNTKHIAQMIADKGLDKTKSLLLSKYKISKKTSELINSLSQ